MAKKPKLLDEPPVSQRGKVDWDEVADLARANPDSWVEVPVPLTSGMSSQIKNGAVRAIDPEEFDVTSRRIKGDPDERRTFYVRLAE